MKLSVHQKDLSAALGRVRYAIAHRSFNPLTLCVRLSTAYGSLCCDGTDLEIALSTSCPAMIEEDGVAAVNAVLLANVVNKLPDDRIAITLNPDTLTLTIECQQYVVELHGLDPADYPMMPNVDADAPSVTLPLATWRACIDEVAFAAAKDESRPALATILTETIDTQMRFVAADGFRLSTSSFGLSDPPATPIRCLVPPRVYTIFQRIANGDLMTLSVDTHRIRLEAQDITLVARLVNDTYPDWERILPTAWANRTVLPVADLQRALNLAILFNQGTSNVLKLTFTPNGTGNHGTVLLAVNTQEVGAAQASLSGVQQGDALTIAVNSKYLSDVVSAVKTQQVELRSQDSTRPLVLQPFGSDASTHIIMPITLRG